MAAMAVAIVASIRMIHMILTTTAETTGAVMVGPMGEMVVGISSGPIPLGVA